MRQWAENDVWAVRALASEGNYNIYRQLKEGKRLFLWAKLSSVAIKYWKGNSVQPYKSTIALVKGANQLRHHRYSSEMSKAKLGELELLVDSLPMGGAKLFPRLRFIELLSLIYFAILILLFARGRHLSLYLVTFFRASKRVAGDSLAGVTTFLCYNDQSFDVASFVHALERRGGCRTVVVQHGLILTPHFYFPTNAREFWAWGEFSKQHYSTRHPNGSIVITGRYASDKESQTQCYMRLPEKEPIRVLVGLSYHHKEIYDGVKIISELRSNLPKTMQNQLNFAFKFHPSTKWKSKIRKFIESHASWMEVVDDDMENLAKTSHVLVTLNSSSAIDFLVLGKRVFFLELHEAKTLLAGYGTLLRLDFKNLLEVSAIFGNRERINLLKAVLSI